MSEQIFCSQTFEYWKQLLQRIVKIINYFKIALT